MGEGRGQAPKDVVSCGNFSIVVILGSTILPLIITPVTARARINNWA